METKAKEHVIYEAEQMESVRRTLKNTYMLLSFCLVVGAGTAFAAMAMGLPALHPLMTLAVFFGISFLINATANKASGVFVTLGFSAFLGYTMSSVVGAYLAMPGGEQTVVMAFGMTGLIFAGMSSWILVTKKDLSGMSMFLFVGLLVAFVMGVANLFFQVPIVSLAVSSMFAILSSLLIAYETSAIVTGGQRNYILAANSLMLSLYNVALSLLNLLGISSSDD